MISCARSPSTDGGGRIVEGREAGWIETTAYPVRQVLAGY